ncbi:MAG: 50S ribosomal protein L11 methyltransferase, partial [Clostridiales Family XIII bacterium]|nr:50S ribosomal protein L11 methyltransferase [Clostridiales Family XIII bacterium]
MMHEKTYLQTKIHTTSAGTEAVSALLLGCGIPAVSVEDRADIEFVQQSGTGWDFIDEALLAGEGGEACVSFYTEDSPDGRALLSEVKLALLRLKADEQYGLYGSEANFGRLYAETVPLADGWQDKWKEHFMPLRLSERVAIRPSWDCPDPT